MPGWKQKGQNGLQNKERTRAVRQLRQWFSTLKTKKTAPRTGTLGERMEGDNLDNSGQLLQGAPPNRAAAVKEKGRRIDSWRCDFPVAPQRMGCGREENGGPPELRIARFPFHFPPAGRHRNFVSRLCKGGNVRWSGSRNGVAASPLGSRAACPCKKKARASCTPRMAFGPFHPAATERGPPGKPERKGRMPYLVSPRAPMRHLPCLGGGLRLQSGSVGRGLPSRGDARRKRSPFKHHPAESLTIF